MRLTWVTAKKEFTSNILSLRLLIGLVVCSMLFVSSTYVLTRDYEKRLSAYNAAKTEHKDELGKVKVYSELKVNVDKPPEPLSALCLGMEKQLGNTVTVSYEDVPTGASLPGGSPVMDIFSPVKETSLPGNPLLNAFSAIDAAVIVQIVLSLFVILIAYDVISGERERGTLGLVMSNPVLRFHILIGKYLGGMASILFPLVIGWIAGILLMLASPMIRFGSAEWGRIGLLFVVSALYLSVFFMFSMLVSTRVARSATSLIWLLFLWVVLVLVIPNGAAYLAAQVQPIESKAKIDIESNAIMEEFWQKVRDYGEKHPSWNYIARDWWVYTGSYPFAYRVLKGSKEAMLWYLDGTLFYVPLRIEYAERIGSLHKGYYQSLKKQTVLAENLSRFSPGWVYYNTSAILAGTDLGQYEQFIKQAQDYRRELMGYMQEQGAFSTIKYFTRADLNELPSQADLTTPEAEIARIKREYNVDELFRRRSEESLSEQEREQLNKGLMALWQLKRASEAILDRMKPESWDEISPLNLSGMPTLTFKMESAINVIKRALPDMAILILLNALLFWGAAAFFLKSEVK